MHQEHAPRVRSPAPAQATTVRPTSLPPPLPHLSLRARASVSTLRAPHTPRLSPRTQQPSTARHAVWGGTTMSRPYLAAPARKGQAQ